MSDLRFEPDDEDQDWPGPDDCETRDKEKPSDTNQIHSELHFPARKPEAAPASPPLEVFDTLESFLQAKGAQFKNKVVASDWSTPEHEMDGEPRVYQKRRKSCSEPEDSCETEDSCDYSSGSEHNYLTVSRKLLKKRSAPLASKTNDSESEQEGQHDEATTVRKARSKHVKHEPIEQKSSQQDDIIILDSDTEDESDQNYKTNAKWCRFNPSSSEDGGDNQRSHSPESVGSRSGRFQEKVNIRRPSLSDSPAPQHQSKPNDTKWKEAVPVARSDPSHSTEKSGQNGRHNINGQQSSKKIDIIILDSDMEDDNDENCGNADMKELFSGSEDSGDATRVQWKRPSTETVDSEDGTAKEKHPSAGPSVPRGDVTKDKRSDVLHSTKKTKPLIEAAGGSENVQHTTNRQMVSEKVVEKAHFRKKRPHRKKVLSSSSSEDDGDDLSATKNRPSTETEDYHCGAAKPKKPRVSPEDAPKKRPQSVDKEAASSSSRGSMNPRVVLMPFSPADHKLKLVKESRFHVQAKDKPCASKTPTAPRPKADSCEKKTQNLHRHKEGKCTSKTKSATDATKKKVQTNTEKLRLVLLPSQRHSSTSVSRSSHTGGQLPESRQSSSSSRWLSQSGETSAASRVPAPKQNTSIPRQPILQRSHSHSGPSTSGRHQAPSKGPLSSATSKLSAKKQVTADWQKSFSPTKRDRKFSLGMERDFHTTNYDSVRDTRTQPSRSDKSATPLMKKSKSDAIELTKAIRRDAPRKPGYPVGQGYKWSEKPAVKRPTKGSRREEKRRRSPQRHRF
ncbi:nucleolar and coiled-body phosphoprotein 1-like [Pempheris klunzingeri]|uniref:nucleolar and coiled-body phosphoprotein 1-like n=1 Tax=Pempheris klunzingeri TaxID=3127111 RepID=UPI0039811919